MVVEGMRGEEERWHMNPLEGKRKGGLLGSNPLSPSGGLGSHIHSNKFFK